MIRAGELAMEEMPFDSKRRLCPDGACVGVIGADGRCSVCRRPAGANAVWASEADPDGDDGAEGNDEGGSATAASSASPSASSFASPNFASPNFASPNASSGFDSKRRLCDDGSCVGIVGADGVCGTCGRKAE